MKWIKFALIVAAACSFCTSGLQAQTTAFTYQGRLDGSGGPVTGSYDFTFALFSASTGGSQLGGTLTKASTTVADGLFTVTLDFGNQFPGSDRWLEIGVRLTGAPSYVTLTPRQPLTSTPYAITAVSVTGSVAAANLTGSIPSGSLTSVPAGNLTGSVPSGSLTSVPAGNLTGSVADARLSANVALRSGGNSFTGNQSVSGSLGIGTTTPNANLEVVSSSTAEIVATAHNSFPIFAGQKANGSPASPSVVQSDNDLAWFGARGYDGQNFSPTRAAMVMKASQNWSTTAHGTDILLATTLNGTTTRTERMRIANNGYVGIGTATPVASLQVSSSNPQIYVTGSGGGFPQFIGQSGNGSAEDPTAVTSGQDLAWFGGQGYTGSGFSATRAAVIMEASQGWNDSANGAEMFFATTLNGTTTRTERMRIANNGYVGIGTATPFAKLHIADPNPQIYVTASGGGVAQFIGQSGNGSAEDPTAVTSGQDLAWFGGQGYTGSGFSATRAAIIMEASQGWNDSANGAEMFFATTPNATTTRTERMRIKQDGKVGIGTDIPDSLLTVNGTASKPGGGSWNTFSDSRLKDVNLQFNRGLEAMDKIQPVHYHYKPGNPYALPSEPDYVGVIAQQVEQAVPEAIERTKDGYLTVNNDPIMWTMFNAIKELNQKVDEKDARIQKQDAENAALKARLDRLERLLTTQTGSNK